jgi:hypothetical protein
MRSIYNSTFQSGMQAILINCNNCAHCVDLRTPSSVDAPTLTNARNKIMSIVTKWLTASAEEEEEEKKEIEVQI